MGSRATRGALALLGIAVACGGDPVADAFARAEDYFERHVRTVDPGWSNLFGYLHRRFGLELENAAGAPLHEVPADQSRPELAAMYRRLVDPRAAVPKQAIADLPTAIDRIGASALHCDRIALPDDWRDVLSRATEAGGYALTHAVLATVWTLENGCWPPLELAPLQRRQVERLVAMAGDRERVLEDYEAGLDLWIEAIVMLHYAGAGARVESAWIDALLAAQRPDGGWPSHPAAGRSDPHATALAMWVLLERLRPEAQPIRWIPPLS